MFRKPIKRLLLLSSGLFILVLAISMALLPGIAFGQATGSQQAARGAKGQCSLATLKGTYLYAFSGTALTSSGQTLFENAGNVTFEGNGHVSGVFSVSVNGKITHFLSFTGTNTINADCTATETDIDATGAVYHFDEFAAPDGSHFAFVQADSGSLTSGIALRVP